MQRAVPLTAALLLASCAGSQPAIDELEYRVLESHEFWGVESNDAVLGALGQMGHATDMVKVMNRWAADGWEHVRTPDDDARVLLQRSRRHPIPYELLMINTSELSDLPVASVENRLNGMARQGWVLMAWEGPLLTFRRPL